MSHDRDWVSYLRRIQRRSSNDASCRALLRIRFPSRWLTHTNKGCGGSLRPEMATRGAFCRRFAALGRFMECTNFGLSPDAVCWRSFAAEDRRLPSCCRALSAIIRGSLTDDDCRATSRVASSKLVRRGFLIVMNPARAIPELAPLTKRQCSAIDRYVGSSPDGQIAIR